MSNPENLITVRNLSFSRENHKVFCGINMDIQRGKITVVMGPSGTGKTTLLQLIGGLLRPLRGSVEVAGQNVHRLSRSALYKLRKRMGMLFQSGALFTHLTVFENVAFPLREHTAFSESKIQNIVLNKLYAVGLRGAKDLLASELSGGMIRRIALARAIALEPMLILYDEPFTGLDPIARGVIVKLVRELNEGDMTSVLVSHDVHEAFSIADYVYLVEGGNIIGQGTPEQLHSLPDPRVQQFIQGKPDGALPFHYPED
jgi:phospholipid/cholesterol/gamma-HCH transport system ATP-binding protein